MFTRKITVLIADDEAPARKRLKTLLSSYPQFTLIAEATNGDEVLKLTVEKVPQIAFLDINMPGASVFNTIPSLKSPPLVVFQTAYSEYGAKAFDINAVDYLMKPISKERFAQAVEKISSHLAEEPTPVASPPLTKSSKDVISVKSNEAIEVLKIEAIHRICVEEGFSVFYCGSQKYYSDKSLNQYEEQLKSQGFYRVSRTDLVSVKLITKLHPMFKGQCQVELTNGDRILVTRRRKQGLIDLLN
jgi:two-component system LytT family response regulator